MRSIPGTPDRLYSLDVLRGVAALAVVFWHWQHFFYDGAALSATFRCEEQPLYPLFFLFYRGGALAVNLFFSLSGFIFFWLYSQSIREGSTSVGTFFLLRFSRLYPLHWVTLAAVAILQTVCFRCEGRCFVYQYNDWYHLLLNLPLLSSVGLEKGESFNGPTWSVSVEVALYVLFFLFCRFFKPGVRVLLVLAASGLFVLPFVYWQLGHGIGSFFLGGGVYHVYLLVLRSRRRWTVTRLLAGLTVVLWVTAAWLLYHQVTLSQALTLVPVRWPVSLPRGIMATLVLFPLTILVLALVETERGTLDKRLSVLGDISYSSYLWHFPLQLLFILIAASLGAPRSVFHSSWVLLGFFAVLLPLSLASYRYLEMPAQRFLRRGWARATMAEASASRQPGHGPVRATPARAHHLTAEHGLLRAG
jgi:peptidoglycan/LPS O-acetylase OafA/YrhL